MEVAEARKEIRPSKEDETSERKREKESRRRGRCFSPFPLIINV